MTFSGDAVWTIIALSRGLPYFTQTLSKHAAIQAIQDRRLEVINSDVETSMEKFIEDTQKSFKEAYTDAIRSNQDNFFEHSLLACALAKTDEEGFFTANDVVEPDSAIMKGRKRIAHFEKHLRRFSSDEGGNILIKRGGERKQIFRFRDPMMQPYVIIRGIQSRKIPELQRPYCSSVSRNLSPSDFELLRSTALTIACRPESDRRQGTSARHRRTRARPASAQASYALDLPMTFPIQISGKIGTLLFCRKCLKLLVGAAGFEPTTCSTQNCRATRLRYTPNVR